MIADTPDSLTSTTPAHLSRATRFAAVLILPVVIALGCGDDGDSGSGGTGGTGATGGVGPAPPSGALLATQRVFTPDGRFVAAQVISDLEGQELDVSQSLELSAFSRTYVFDGRVFVFDGENLQVSRYVVGDDLTLTEDGRLSMMGVGITNFQPTVIFVSPTRAIYVGLEEIAVVFNPEAMEITSTFDVPGITREGLIARFTAPARIGDEIYLAIGWWDSETASIYRAVAALVLSAEEDRLLRLVEDERCVYGQAGFAFEGAYYIVGNNFNGWFDLLLPGELPSPCLLRLPEGAAEFDPGFYVDLESTTGSRFFAGPPWEIGGGNFLNQIFDSAEDPFEFEDPTTILGGSFWRWSVISLPGGEVTRLEELPLSTTNPFIPFRVDGVAHFTVDDVTEMTSTVYRIDPETLETSSVLLSRSGQIIGLERIR